MMKRLLLLGAVLVLMLAAIPAMAGGDKEPPETEACFDQQEVTQYRYEKQIAVATQFVRAPENLQLHGPDEWVDAQVDITNRPGGPWILDVPKKLGDGNTYRYVEFTRSVLVDVEVDCPEICEWNPELLADDEVCVPPTTPTTAPPPPTTVTTEPPTYGCDPETGEVVEILPGDPDYPGAVTDPSLVVCVDDTVVTTVTTAPPPPTDPTDPPDDVTVSTLPYTGIENPGPIAVVGASIMVLGGLIALAARGRKEDDLPNTQD